MQLSRRQFLASTTAGAGALLVARPTGVLAQQLPSIDGWGTPRESRLFPGSFCVHSDMHNHSLLSDGDGQPDNFFGLMRESGIDVASLTDHAVINDLAPGSACGTFALPGNHYAESDANELSKGCQGIAGLDEASWQDVKAMADAAHADGDFAAIAGFEWSSPTLGHINVWFSQDFTDPLHTGGLSGLDDALLYAQNEGFPLPDEVVALAQQLLADVPAAGNGIVGFQDWLKTGPGSPGLGGGSDGIFGFNHPGREPSRFEDFAFDADLVDRAVSMELFNKTEDYLFELTDKGRTSPLVACLDAGWRPGILGTSDYHGTDWGTPDNRGRAGMYVSSLSRDSVRTAMEARQFFAARITGLRLDASANGVRMGQTLGHSAGVIRFHLDVDRGPGWYGKRLNVQVLQTGSPLPTVVDNVEVVVPTPSEPVISFEVPIDVANGRWVVLRLTDPDEPAEELSPDGSYDGFGRSFAYASPFYLDPDQAPPAPSPEPSPDASEPAPMPPAPEPAAGGSLPATGGGSLGLVAGAAAMAGAGLLHLRKRGLGHDHDHGHGHTHD